MVTSEDLCRVTGIIQIREALCALNNKIDSQSFVTLDTVQSITASKTFTKVVTFSDTWSNYQAIYGSSGQGGRLSILNSSGTQALRIGTTSATDPYSEIIASNQLVLRSDADLTMTANAAGATLYLQSNGNNSAIALNAYGTGTSIRFLVGSTLAGTIDSNGTLNLSGATWANYQATFGSLGQGGRIKFLKGNDGTELASMGAVGGGVGSTFQISTAASSSIILSAGQSSTFTQSATSGSTSITATGNSGVVQLTASGTTAGQIRFQTSATESGRIFTNGNWRIGSTGVDNGSKLQVEGAATIEGQLQVNGSTISTQYKLSALNTAPATATATGTLGEIRVTAGYIYVCTATNTWVRAALATW